MTFEGETLKTKHLLSAGAMIAAGSLILTGCAAPDRGGDLAEGGPSITVSWNDPFFSWNTNTSHGNAAQNAVVTQTANDGFFSYDNEPSQVLNEDFGTIEEVSEDPLTVKYTVNEGVTWSDGTQVGGADLLLGWAAMTTHVSAGDIPAEEYDDEGNVTNQDAIDAAAADGIFWGTGANTGLQIDLISQTPEIGDDGRSLTVVY
ncbi:MAG: ABC transporter family substrate-binding protein, partial [Pseudoclavibacter sp.]